jgi:hypothetical protein
MTEAEHYHSAQAVLVSTVKLGERRAQQPAGPCRLPQSRQMRLEAIEDQPVALGEVATAAATEEKGLRVPERRGNGDFDLMLDPEWPEPVVVHPCPVQFARRQEVGELDRPEVPLLLA